MSLVPMESTDRSEWMSKPEDVTDEEHASFYKSLSNNWVTTSL